MRFLFRIRTRGLPIAEFFVKPLMYSQIKLIRNQSTSKDMHTYKEASSAISLIFLRIFALFL